MKTSSRIKLKARARARYQDPQLLREVRDWFYTDSDKRISAHQFAQAHSYNVLNSILPALTRIGQHTGKEREAAIREEIMRGHIKSVSTKMFLTFLYAVLVKPKSRKKPSGIIKRTSLNRPGFAPQRKPSACLPSR